jgi:hypothetical protein
MPKLATYLVIALLIGALTGTASAYVIRRKSEAPPQSRHRATPLGRQVIQDWAGPERSATIWR